MDQIKSSVSRFTPAPDILVEAYGITCAVVWGKIWRYCQMEDEVCRAAQERLSDELNISRPTLDKYIKILEDDKYIKDKTPTLRNKPHIFITTAKLQLKVSIFMEQSTVKNFYTESKDSLLEESTTTGSEVLSNVFTHYQNNIAMLTPIMADTLQDAEKTYSEAWVMEAIGLAVTNNKRNWRYCEAILKRWQADGKDEGKKKRAEDQPAQPRQKTELQIFMESQNAN